MTMDQKSAAFPSVKADLTTAAQVDVFYYFLSSLLPRGKKNIC